MNNQPQSPDASPTVQKLPQYQCHKVVGAVKISAIDHKPNPDPTGASASCSYGAIITPEHMTLHAFEVSAEYVTKHRPQVGGYYVRYADGYESYSPAEAFESGYALIEYSEANTYTTHEERQILQRVLNTQASNRMNAVAQKEGAEKVLNTYSHSEE